MRLAVDHVIRLRSFIHFFRSNDSYILDDANDELYDHNHNDAIKAFLKHRKRFFQIENDSRN